jgi:Ycf66 protein N-terminus
VNFGTPVPLLIGIILILFSVFLFFLEKFKPGYKRDSDVIYASLALAAGILNLVDLSGGFLHASQSVIFTGIFISLALEAINGRTPDNTSTRQSGGMPDRDDDRGPRNYRAGVEDSYTALDDRSSRRQMRDGRGRDEYDSRSPGRNDRDRFLEDRPRRRSRYDEPSANPDTGRTGRSGRDEFGDDIRSIPERTSASDSPRDRGRGEAIDRSSAEASSLEDVPRPRRRPMDDEARSPRRSSRPPMDDVAPPSDYVEFRPVEPIPPKESWGPKDS